MRTANLLRYLELNMNASSFRQILANAIQGVSYKYAVGNLSIRLCVRVRAGACGNTHATGYREGYAFPLPKKGESGICR